MGDRTDAVYPRACGGTIKASNILTDEMGLSPRLRGNHLAHWGDRQDLRSIPAPAGEPHLVFATPHTVPVYPRACGGTLVSLFGRPSFNGLSPRLRGNRSFLDLNTNPKGSIPAPAGEPSSGCCWDGRHRVYPSACGGTSGNITPTWSTPGLSPRLRGNLRRRLRATCPAGSIPAPAGEPDSCLCKGHTGMVYPRACGGTAAQDASYAAIDGLSPRLRGNLGRVRLVVILAGSIPAPAGEP